MNTMFTQRNTSAGRQNAPGLLAPPVRRAWLRAAILCMAALMVAAATLAAPASWYLWRSKLSGELYCAQTSPGQGWVLSGGPFKDLACQQRGRPGR